MTGLKSSKVYVIRRRAPTQRRAFALGEDRNVDICGYPGAHSDAAPSVRGRRGSRHVDRHQLEPPRASSAGRPRSARIATMPKACCSTSGSGAPGVRARRGSQLERSCVDVSGSLAAPGVRAQRGSQPESTGSVADYLEQVGSRERFGTYPPESLWTALATTVTDPELLRRLGREAADRGRYQHAIWLFARSADHGDTDLEWLG